MKLSEKLEQLLKEFSGTDCEVLEIAQDLSESLNEPDILDHVASLCFDVSSKLKELITVVKDKKEEEKSEVEHSDEISLEKLESLAALADEFDSSDDEFLQKQASVIDEILLTIGADRNYIKNFKAAEDAEITKLRDARREAEIKEKYSDIKDIKDKQNGVAEAKKVIEEKIKKYNPLEASLSTRHSPDMPGVSLIRIGDGIFQCPVTKKIFNYNTGFTTARGNKVPGTSVEEQTRYFGDKDVQGHYMFSTREEALNKG